MKRLMSGALVGVLAVGTVAATAAVANADPYYYYQYGHYPHGHYYPHDRGYHDDGGGYLAAGILGLTAGLVASQVLEPTPPPPPPPSYYASGYGPESAHIQWCTATYRSYNPETDLWVDYAGLPHQCAGPY